jgi:hypothetical protein
MAQRGFGEFLADLVVKTDCRGVNQTAPDSSPAPASFPVGVIHIADCC